MVGSHGKCPFKTYLKSKPDKYGIKLYSVCDTSTGYLCNSITYLGKDRTKSRTETRGCRQEPPASTARTRSSSTRGSGRTISSTRGASTSATPSTPLMKTTRYVMELVRALHNTQCTVVCDNYFTSIELCNELLQLNLYLHMYWEQFEEFSRRFLKNSSNAVKYSLR